MNFMRSATLTLVAAALLSISGTTVTYAWTQASANAIRTNGQRHCYTDYSQSLYAAGAAVGKEDNSVRLAQEELRRRQADPSYNAADVLAAQRQLTFAQTRKAAVASAYVQAINAAQRKLADCLANVEAWVQQYILRNPNQTSALPSSGTTRVVSNVRGVGYGTTRVISNVRGESYGTTRIGTNVRGTGYATTRTWGGGTMYGANPYGSMGFGNKGTVGKGISSGTRGVGSSKTSSSRCHRGPDGRIHCGSG